ncbi:DMT family transporter, partial [Acinetobacter baumannii]|uniref:DMT family transporter n=1 Tax=Acinetobacter baumannii TaxID=470 RepID=UPI000AD64030
MMKFSSHLFLILPLAMGIGVALAVQTAINAQLREKFPTPLKAELLSFSIGSIVLTIMVFFQSAVKPRLSDISHIP